MARASSPAAGEGHDHTHEHEHDHTHVAIESVALQLGGIFERPALEEKLHHLLLQPGLIRVKGLLWSPGKARPLQIQAVGARLECWYEAGAQGSQAAQPGRLPGLELVFLGFQLNRPAIEALLLEGATPP